MSQTLHVALTATLELNMLQDGSAVYLYADEQNTHTSLRMDRAVFQRLILEGAGLLKRTSPSVNEAVEAARGAAA